MEKRREKGGRMKRRYVRLREIKKRCMDEREIKMTCRRKKGDYEDV